LRSNKEHSEVVEENVSPESEQVAGNDVVKAGTVSLENIAEVDVADVHCDVVAEALSMSLLMII
jgi:hypothetical protein